MGDAVALLDVEGGFRYANEAYQQLLLASHGELAAHARSLVAGGPFDDELVVRGARRRVLRASRRCLGGGAVLVTWRDVTAERDRADARERQAVLDPLTGIANRRGAEEAMTREHARARRLGTPLTLAVFDVDHFKQWNDHHGHAGGDSVLRRVAAVLVREARASDTVARWGGDEFVAVLPSSLEGARAFCDRVCAALAADGLAITLSGGLAALEADEPLAETLARADTCLYDSKRAGRARVTG